MKKKFKFTLELTVELKENLEGQMEAADEKANILFQEFLKDDKAILDFYKLWLLGNFRIEDHYNAIGREITAKDENLVIKSVLKKTPPDVQAYFLEILDSTDDSRLEDLEKFYERFDLLEFDKASFEEIKQPGRK